MAIYYMLLPETPHANRYISVRNIFNIIYIYINNNNENNNMVCIYIFIHSCLPTPTRVSLNLLYFGV